MAGKTAAERKRRTEKPEKTKVREKKKTESAGKEKRAAEHPRKSIRRESARMAAAEARRREVVRERVIIGCIAAAIVIALLLAVILPRVLKDRSPKGTLVGVNSDVLQYTDAVLAECKAYDITEYATLLLALMQQESSGQGTDVFQCSESPFNTEYESSPGSIDNVDYSIQVGVETFAYCLEVAGCKRISDTNALKLALQEYNFGNNYAGWAIENYGGYSQENAQEFSEKMKAELGWDTYGDPEYVQHVLQYITF